MQPIKTGLFSKQNMYVVDAKHMINNSNCLRFIIDTAVIKHIAQEVLTILDRYRVVLLKKKKVKKVKWKIKVSRESMHICKMIPLHTLFSFLSIISLL